VKRPLLRSSAFVHAAKKYVKKNPSAPADIQAALKLLSDDALHVQLKAHKLKGTLEGFWACSAGYDLRIVFRFVPWEAGELQSPDAKGTGPCFRPSLCPKNAISGRKMDQSPDFAVLVPWEGKEAILLETIGTHEEVY